MRLTNGIGTLPEAAAFYYLATPYSKWPVGIDDAADHAAALAGRLLREGVPAFSPIAHSHPIARQAKLDPLDHALWLPFDKRVFAAASGLIVAMLPGWKESYGIGEEIKWAKAAGKMIVWLEPDGLTWSRAAQ